MAKNLMKELVVKETKSNWFSGKEFVKRLEQGYLKPFSETKFTTKKTFAPSTLAWNQGECPRYWYIAFEGADFVPDEKDAKAIANMQHGTVSHDRIQKAFGESDINIDVEVKIRNEDPPIFGYADGIMEWAGDDNVVLEIKTCREEAFARIKSSGTPRKYHLFQVLLYMKIRKASKGVLLYESKNANELLAFPVDLTPEYIDYFDYLWGWLREVRGAWENKQLPEKNYRSNSRVCKSCPVKSTCDTLGDGTIKIKSLEALPDVEKL